MAARLDRGDLIFAKVTNYDRTREPLISIDGKNLGKIDSGELVRISPVKVPRLIGKQGSMIQTIEAATNTSITIGQNGLIVFACDNSTSLKKSIACIKMVDLLLDDSNLEKKIQNMLDENN